FGARFYPTLDSMSQRDAGVAVEQALDYMNNRVATKAHNDYLEVWAENGTPAFLALLLAIVLTLWLGWKSFGGRPDEERDSTTDVLLLSLYPAFLCILLYSLFS